ncbi:MAG: hypothetical protein AAF518_04580 [Spirochaetota bacterium]
MYTFAKKLLFCCIFLSFQACNPFLGAGSDAFSRVLALVSNDTGSTNTISYQITGQLKDSSGTVVSGASMNASTLNTNTSIRRNIQDNGVTIVTAVPNKLSFVDIDPRKGFLAGFIRINKADDESQISYYNLYWTDSIGSKIQRIARLQKTGVDYVYAFPTGTEAPATANGFLAISGNSLGESSNFTIHTIKDTEFQFFTNASGDYTMDLAAGKYNIGIVSADGVELGSMTLELPETLDPNSPPTPTLTDGDFTVTVTGIGEAGSPITPVQVSSDNTNTAPTASTPSVSGTVASGQTLTASYTFMDTDGHSEGSSVQQWYRCTDNTTTGSCSAISGAASAAYTIQSTDDEYYLRYSVTPLDQNSLAGAQVYSAATTQLLISPTVGNSGILTASAIAATNSVTLAWTAATDGKTDQSSLTYTVYKSTSNNITTVAEMEANGTQMTNATNITSYTASLTASTVFYLNVLVQDSYGNKSAYGGYHRQGVWVGGSSNLPSGTTTDWTEVSANCPTVESGGACIRSLLTNGSSLSFSVTYDKPGTMFFIAKGTVASSCTFTVSGGTSYSADFSTDALYSVNLNSGTNVFTLTNTGAGSARCSIDRLRY